MDKCNHEWMKVKQDSTIPLDMDYLICSRCNETRLVKKPVRKESSKDEKPLLME